MKYMGSKNRIAKHILPIMLVEAEKNGITKWVEPFVGGANMIDKVPNTFVREGYDLNPHTIAALTAIRDMVDMLPNDVTEQEYDSVKFTSDLSPIKNLIRFGASFGGKFDAGFARGKTDKGDLRDYWKETKRNAQKQSPLLQTVKLSVASYLDLDIQNSLIYCFNENTEILTDNGWLNIKDVTTEDKCLSREPNSSKLEYKKVVKTHKTKSQRMFYYKSKMLDFSITDDHNMFVNKKLGRDGVRKDMFIKPKNLNNYNFQFVNAGGIWNGVTPNKMHIGEFEVDTLPFMYLLGVFLSDGSVNNQKSVTISQKKPNIIEKIRGNLNEMGLPYREYLDNRYGMTTFYLNKSWSKFLSSFI